MNHDGWYLFLSISNLLGCVEFMTVCKRLMLAHSTWMKRFDLSVVASPKCVPYLIGLADLAGIFNNEYIFKFKNSKHVGMHKRCIR
jgi:hypothetical protein